MDLSIIIVNWNSKEYLQKCIASILMWTSDIKYEIMVIDSASFDGCGEMLQTMLSRRFDSSRARKISVLRRRTTLPLTCQAADISVLESGYRT